jgi:uncharacterized protein DUF6175
MKKQYQLLITMCFILISNIVFSQAKKPTLMVVPSDVWCIQNGYVINFDDQGTIVQIPDYKKAYQNNPDVLIVISQINSIMADKGFPLKNMESAIKTLNSNSAEDNMRTSKASGSAVSESPIDALKKVAKADIIMQLTWVVNKTGPKNKISFNLQGLDAYTDKQVATAVGVGNPSFSSTVSTLLLEAVIAHMDKFAEDLIAHFKEMEDNGREIIVRIQKWDDWDGDLETEFDGEELGFIIEDWLAEHTKKGRFSTTDMTEDMALFEQVRIPLYNDKGRAIDARRYVRDLSKFLNSPPYNIPNKLVMKGLGRATIILGSK